MRFVFVALLFSTACGADTPVPAYPFPERVPLEDSDLAEFVEGDLEEESYEEDENWDDGLSDEGLELDGESDNESTPATS